MILTGGRGQTILEYTLIVTILTVVFFYMGTSIKRGVQSLVKVTADQVGNQQNADQDFNDVQSGYMIGSNTDSQENSTKQVNELGYIPDTNETSYIMTTMTNESMYTMTKTITNAGFQENQ